MKKLIILIIAFFILGCVTKKEEKTVNFYMWGGFSRYK